MLELLSWRSDGLASEVTAEFIGWSAQLSYFAPRFASTIAKPLEIANWFAIRNYAVRSSVGAGNLGDAAIVWASSEPDCSHHFCEWFQKFSFPSWLAVSRFRDCLSSFTDKIFASSLVADQKDYLVAYCWTCKSLAHSLLRSSFLARSF